MQADQIGRMVHEMEIYYGKMRQNWGTAYEKVG